MCKLRGATSGAVNVKDGTKPISHGPGQLLDQESTCTMSDGVPANRMIRQRPDNCSCTSIRKWRTPLSFRESASVHVPLLAGGLSVGPTAAAPLGTRRGASLKGFDCVDDPGAPLESIPRSTPCSPRYGIAELTIPASRARVTSCSTMGTTAAPAKVARTWTATCFAEIGSAKKPSRRK